MVFTNKPLAKMQKKNQKYFANGLLEKIISKNEKKIITPFTNVFCYKTLKKKFLAPFANGSG
jgi:TolB-like protein